MCLLSLIKLQPGFEAFLLFPFIPKNEQLLLYLREARWAMLAFLGQHNIVYLQRVGRILSVVLRGGNSMNWVLPLYCSNVKIHNFQWCSLLLWWVRPTPAYSRGLKCQSFPFCPIPYIYPYHHNLSVFKKESFLTKLKEFLSFGISASTS